MLWDILYSTNRVTVSVYIVRVFLVHRSSLLHPHLTVQQVTAYMLNSTKHLPAKVLGNWQSFYKLECSRDSSDCRDRR